MRFSSLTDWLAWQETLHPTTIDLGLGRVQATLQALDWRRPACPVVTVAGTNGKGSTVALLASILGAAGYRVGTFTSPHLVRYNERITIAGQYASNTSLMHAFERIDAARQGTTLTFFEFNTLAALLLFETAGLDAIVLEVGMGGRLDAVNVVDADVAVISSIGLDHCDWLGRDLDAIGAEKAGVLRQARPAIFGARQMPDSIARIARELGSDLRRLGVDFDWQRNAGTWDWHDRDVRHNTLPLPALRGDIQLDNAASALAALAILADRLPVSRGAIERGLTRVSLPGRFQVIARNGTEWILDVAHNSDAAVTLSGRLGELPARSPTIAVLGVLADKDWRAIAESLAGRFEGWITAGLSGPRALSPHALAEGLRAMGLHVLAECTDVATACARAREIAPKGRIVVFGSFLTVGPALQWLGAL